MSEHLIGLIDNYNNGLRICFLHSILLNRLMLSELCPERLNNYAFCSVLFLFFIMTYDRHKDHAIIGKFLLSNNGMVIMQCVC